MKKIIIAVLILLGSSLFSNLWGQKNRKMPQSTLKSDISQEKNVPVSTEIKNVAAFSDGNGVFIKWETNSESNLIGFNIYKNDGTGNVQINKNIIVSSLLLKGQSFAEGDNYNYFDEKGGFQTSYLIESVFSNGKRVFNNPILPNYSADLRNISVLSYDQLRKSKTIDNSVFEISKLSSASRTNFRQENNSQSFTNLDTQKWVASQPGVKITINKEGFYRVTRAELEANGFDVNASTQFWQLYTNGIEQAIIVDSNDQYIEFYGANVEENLESNKQTYYLLVGPNAGRRMDSRVVRPVGGTLPATTYYQIQTTKQHLYYAPGIINGGHTNFFGALISTTPASVNFTVKGIDYSIRKTDMNVVIQGLSMTPHLTKIVVNGNDIGTVSGANQASMSLEFTIPTSFLNEGTNILELTSLASSTDYSFFDMVSVNPQRKYLADDNQLSLYTNDFRSCDILGFTSNTIRVFDVTNEGSLTKLTNLSVNQENGLYSVNIPAYETRKLFALTDAAIKNVDSIKPNTPSTLSTTAHTAQLVIISHKNWLTEANTWANYRRADGMSVEVVVSEDIYDEFNYGRLSANSILDFAQYAKNNWQVPPSYIMLMGDATYDPLNYTGAGEFNFVPTKLVDILTTETGSDDALTDFNYDGLAEIPIGRLPVRSGTEVTQLFNKVSVFEQTLAQNFARGALCASDFPDGFDFAALCSRVLNELPGSLPKMFVNRGDADASNVLLNSLNSGKYLVNYSGHGHVAIWANSSFFNSTTALNLTNGNNLSIFTMLTCLNGYFIEPASSSLSENLLKAQNGGAVVSWSSSGLTTPDIQEIMARRFYNQVGVGNLTRMGDLVNDAKTVLNGGREVRLSWVLLGDPTLKVR